MCSGEAVPSHPKGPSGERARSSPTRGTRGTPGTPWSRRRLTRTLAAKKSSDTTPAADSSAISSWSEMWSGKRGAGGNCTRGPQFANTLGDNDLGIPGFSRATPQQHDPGTNLHNLTAVDPRLARLCVAWTSLPEHFVLAILALAESARVVEVL